MARYIADFTGTDENIFLGLVNNDNKTSFTPAQIIFGEAAAVVGEDPLATTLTLTAATGSGYRGSQTFTYSRVPLSFMSDLDPTLKIVTDELRSVDLLAFLNEHFGVNITADDIVDEALPDSEPDADVTYVLKASATSKIFTGEVTLTMTAPTVDLATVLTVTALGGLDAPTALPVDAG